jgi:hypothetical protein
VIWRYYANYSTRDDTSRCNWHHWMGWVRAAKSRTAPGKAGRETGTTCERLLLKADHNLGLAGRNLKINATLAVGSDGRVEVDCGHWNRALPPALLHLQRVNRQSIVTGFDSLSIGKNEHCRQSRLRERRFVARFRLLATVTPLLVPASFLPWLNAV